MLDKLGQHVPALIRFIVILLIIVAIVWLAAQYVGTRFVYGTVDYVVDNLSSRSGLSPYLVRGLVILLTIPFFWAVAKFTGNVIGLINLGWTTPLEFYRKPCGIVIIGYVGLSFLAMYLASRDAYAYKFCAETDEGIFTSDGPGKDPVYGVETKPCTPTQIRELRNGTGKLAAPREIEISNVNSQEWFNGVTARPMVWYADINGSIHFFDRPGSDPHSGVSLRPVTPEFVQQLKLQRASREEASKRALAEQEARNAKAKEVADLRSFSDQAQKQFDTGNYLAASETCDQVLKRDSKSEPCMTLQQHAAVKAAEELASQAQAQLEQGQMDEAIWASEKAVKLDPSNARANKIREFAKQMKHSTN